MVPGKLLPLPEEGAEIPVQEFHAVLPAHGPGHGADGLVVLVGADEQGGGEAVKAVLGGIAGGLLHPHPVAVGAAAVDVVGYMLDELAQAVVIDYHQREGDLPGIVLQAGFSAAVLGIGVDIGIVPEAGQLDALLPQGGDGAVGAGGAADMHQRLHVSLLVLGRGSGRGRPDAWRRPGSGRFRPWARRHRPTAPGQSGPPYSGSAAAYRSGHSGAGPESRSRTGPEWPDTGAVLPQARRRPDSRRGGRPPE